VSSYFYVTVVCNTTSVRFFSFIPHDTVTVTWKLCDDLWNLYASVVWMVDLTWRVACGWKQKWELKQACITPFHCFPTPAKPLHCQALRGMYSVKEGMCFFFKLGMAVLLWTSQYSIHIPSLKQETTVRHELVCISELGFLCLFTNLQKLFNCLSCKQNKQGYRLIPVTVKRVRIDPWLVRSTVILILFVRSKTKSFIEVNISWKILVRCESLYII